MKYANWRKYPTKNIYPVPPRYRSIMFCAQPVICAVAARPSPVVLIHMMSISVMLRACEVRSARNRFVLNADHGSTVENHRPGRAKEVLSPAGLRCLRAERWLCQQGLPWRQMLESVGTIAREMATYDHAAWKKPSRLQQSIERRPRWSNADSGMALPFIYWFGR